MNQDFSTIPHPQRNYFAQRLRELVSDGAPAPWRSIVYRYTLHEYSAVRRMMNGRGAFEAGGRWNSPGTFHAVYCSSSPDLANREHFASCQAARISYHSKMPLVGRAVEVNLTQVLDLRDPSVLTRIGVTQAELDAVNWRLETDSNRESLCQTIGWGTWQAGIEALIVPSGKAQCDQDFNIVLIIENSPPGSGKWRVLKAGKK